MLVEFGIVVQVPGFPEAEDCQYATFPVPGTHAREPLEAVHIVSTAGETDPPTGLALTIVVFELVNTESQPFQ